MTLLVLGGGSAALVTAGFAAAVSREPVLVGEPDGHARFALTDVELAGSPLPVLLAWATAGLDATCYVLAGDIAAHDDLLRANADAVAGRPLLIAPGGVGAALAVERRFESWGRRPPLVTEAAGFPAIGHVRGSTVVIRAVKRAVPAWATPSAVGGATDAFAPYLPNLAWGDLATVTLANTNAVIHPGVTVANAARIRRGERFRFYREGLTPDAIETVEAVDADRMAIARALGAPDHPASWWMRTFYADQGMQGASLAEQLRAFEPFADSMAPTSFLDRYLVDDISFGLAPLEAIAGRLGVAVPAIGSVVDEACVLADRDLRSHAVALAGLVLDALRADQPAPAESMSQ